MKVAAWNYGLLNHNQNTTKLFTLRENMTFLEADSAVFFLEPFLNQDNCWVHQFNPPPRQRVNPCIRNDHYHIFQSRPMLFHLKVDKTFGVFRRQKISCQMIILKKGPQHQLSTILAQLVTKGYQDQTPRLNLSKTSYFIKTILHHTVQRFDGC